MSLFDYVQNGGPIMYILIFLNVVGFSVLIWKGMVLFAYRKNIADYAQKLAENFSQRKEVNGLSVDARIALLKDDVSEHVHQLEAGLSTVKIIAGVAPLMGLLGTVIGILSAFRVIGQSGLDNPALFAGGISTALITTVGGLIVAIPHVVGYNYLSSWITSIEVKLENQVVAQSVTAVNSTVSTASTSTTSTSTASTSTTGPSHGSSGARRTLEV